MKQIYQCDICKTTWRHQSDAKKCESRCTQKKQNGCQHKNKGYSFYELSDFDGIEIAETCDTCRKETKTATIPRNDYTAAVIAGAFSDLFEAQQ